MPKVRKSKMKSGKGLRKENRFQATGPPATQTVPGTVTSASYSGDNEKDPSVLKSHIPELLLLYEQDPNDYNKQQLINLLTQVGNIEEQQKKDELIKEIGGSKKTVFADLFHSKGTAEIGQDLESLSVEQLEDIKNGRNETRKNEAKPWYEKAKNVLETAVVPAIGDVAHILGRVIPGLNLLTDKIEDVTNHGVHSWDDLGVFGSIIDLAPEIARQVIPTGQITNALEAGDTAKNLIGGKIRYNPYAMYYRRGRQLHKSKRS